MSDTSKLLRVGSAGALVLLLDTTNVRAAEGQNIEEVIVTAQKRAQALIDVPQSVSVVDGGVRVPHRRVQRVVERRADRYASEGRHTGFVRRQGRRRVAVHAGVEREPERELRVVGGCTGDGLYRRLAAASVGSDGVL